MIEKPVLVLVCATCDQPWDDHLTRAKRRLVERNSGYGDDYEWVPYKPTTDEVVEEVSVVEDCGPLLKSANRGPTGPVGPMGAQGEPGRSFLAPPPAA